jgi:hypothetical protein
MSRLAVAPTGRDQELVVSELLGGIERDGACRCVGRHDPLAAPLDAVLVIPGGGLDIPAVEALLGA